MTTWTGQMREEQIFSHTAMCQCDIAQICPLHAQIDKFVLSQRGKISKQFFCLKTSVETSCWFTVTECLKTATPNHWVSPAVPVGWVMAHWGLSKHQFWLGAGWASCPSTEDCVNLSQYPLLWPSHCSQIPANSLFEQHSSIRFFGTCLVWTVQVCSFDYQNC